MRLIPLSEARNVVTLHPHRGVYCPPPLDRMPPRYSLRATILATVVAIAFIGLAWGALNFALFEIGAVGLRVTQ